MDAKRLAEIRKLYDHVSFVDDWVTDEPPRTNDQVELQDAVPALLDYIDALKAENARMRHDLDTTDGLYASDQEDMSHSFRLEHASLRHKPEA